jgi:hypothetical protein
LEIFVHEGVLVVDFVGHLLDIFLGLLDEFLDLVVDRITI